MKFYLDWGSRIAAGQWTDHQAFYGLPGYAYWLAVILMLTGGSPIAASLIAGALQAIAFAAVGALIFVFARRAISMPPQDSTVPAGGGVAIVTAIGAAAGWTLFAPAQAYSVVLMPTVGAVLAYWGGVHLLSRSTSQMPLWAWACLGLLIGVTALFIATIFFLLPLAGFTIVRNGLRDPGHQKVLRATAAAVAVLAGVLLGTAPAWLHNTLAAKDPVLLSAHSGINMWIGNNPVANGYPKIPQGLRSGQEGLLRDSLLIPQKEAGRPLRRSEVSQFWNSKARKWIEENRGAWLRLVGTKLVNFWNAFQYDDINVLRLLRSDRITAGFSSFGIISALGLAGIPLVAWRLPYSRWVVAGVLLHMLALVPVFVTERYRLAAVPGLLVCGSLGVFLLWQAFTRHQWITAVTYVSVVAGSVAFVSLPRGEAGAWALSHYNVGVRMLLLAERARAIKESERATSELARSQRELEIAFAYAPGSTEINLALGNLHLEKQDIPRAKLFYARVLSIDCNHLSGLNNLGVLALNENRWSIAANLLTRACDLDPTSPKSHYLLARALQGAGDFTKALAAIKRAISLRPHQIEFLELEQSLNAQNP